MESKKEEILDKEPIRQIIESIGQITSSDLIPILQQIQKVYGYLPLKILAEVSKLTTIPSSRIYGVATFYEQFHLQPHGRHMIKCCRGTACHVKGGPDIIHTIQTTLNIKPGQTTKDGCFTFETVACLGTCFLAPVIMINNDYYGHLTSTEVINILKKYS